MHTEPYRGDWLQTYSGRRFFPLDPRPEEIFIEDIAAALSKMCRYGGHATRFYSVAEHSVHLANAASDQHKLTALLHDAYEGYVVDVPQPIKSSLSNYAQIEHRGMRAVAVRFGIQWPLPAEVKRLDNAILADERAQIMATCAHDWSVGEPALGIRIECWAPEKAEYEFLSAFHRLTLYGKAA